MNIQGLKVLAVIPARGGSKGIPQKNIRLLNGQPLISYTINAVKESKYISKCIVSTDDDEIKKVVKAYNIPVIERPSNLATDDIPLDPVIFNAVRQLENQGEYFDIVVTIQPTSPLLKAQTLDAVIEYMLMNNFDTVLTATDDRHLSWTKKDGEFQPKYLERKNRQYLPVEYRETGAVLATKRKVMTESNRLGSNLSIFEVDKYESVDIDSRMDWWIAEKLLKMKKIVIRVDGYKEIGLGHIYRTLTLANHIIDHEVIFLMDERHELGINLVKEKNFKVELFTGSPIPKMLELEPDIIINDILDTDKEYILTLKKIGKVFNFEDLGEGAEFADGVFNALYPGTVPADNFYTGEKYYCARPEFMLIKPKVIEEKVQNVLITFGGTDPNNLTLKALKALSILDANFEINVILGPGYSHDIESEVSHFNNIKIHKHVNNMAEHMYNADIIFSSAGRTMYEIAMVGTPAVIISQNYRELTHLFGHSYNGFMNLGIHHEVSEQKIADSFTRLYSEINLRKVMNKRMLQHNLKQGIDRVLSIILK